MARSPGAVPRPAPRRSGEVYAAGGRSCAGACAGAAADADASLRGAPRHRHRYWRCTAMRAGPLAVHAAAPPDTPTSFAALWRRTAGQRRRPAPAVSPERACGRRRAALSDTADCACLRRPVYRVGVLERGAGIEGGAHLARSTCDAGTVVAAGARAGATHVRAASVVHHGAALHLPGRIRDAWRNVYLRERDGVSHQTAVVVATVRRRMLRCAIRVANATDGAAAATATARPRVGTGCDATHERAVVYQHQPASGGTGRSDDAIRCAGGHAHGAGVQRGDPRCWRRRVAPSVGRRRLRARAVGQDGAAPDAVHRYANGADWQYGGAGISR